MFRAAYGLLKWTPETVRRHTVGEVLDVIGAYAWRAQQERPQGPMDAMARAQELARFDEVTRT